MKLLILRNVLIVELGSLSDMSCYQFIFNNLSITEKNRMNTFPYCVSSVVSFMQSYKSVLSD
jgi:hypothetical protein